MDFFSLIELDTVPDTSVCGYARAGDLRQIQAWTQAQNQCPETLGEDCFVPAPIESTDPFSGIQRGFSAPKTAAILPITQRENPFLKEDRFKSENLGAFEDVFNDVDHTISRQEMEAVWGLPDMDADTPQHGTALMHAARHGHADCVAALLPFSDAKAQTTRGLTALGLAAAHGHIECVKRLLPRSDALASVSVRDFFGMTALAMAVANGHAHCVSALLPHSDANQRAGDALQGDTALHTAVRHRRLDCARILLSDAHPDALNDEGLTPLFLACSRYPIHETDPLHGVPESSPTLGDGPVGDFIRLLAPISDAGFRDPEQSLTPLLALCAVDGWLRRPDFDAEALSILAQRSDGDATDSEGCTALMLAARSGNLAAAQALAPICSVNARDHNTYSALSLALLFQHEEIALFLLSLPDIDIYGAESIPAAPASPHARRSPGDPPSVSAVNQSAMAGRLASHKGHGGASGLSASLSIGRRDVVAQSATSGPGRPAVSKQAPSAAAFAANHGFTDVLRAVFALDPEELHRVDAFGLTPLMHAVRQQRLDAIRFLLPLSDTGVRLPGRESVFDLALRHKSPDCLRLLLPRVDLRSTNLKGDTPLMRAIADGARDEACLAILAATPRDAIDCVNKEGLTAFLIAIQEDRKPLLRPLAAAGNPLTAGAGVETALDIGVKKRNFSLIDLVLEHAPEHLVENSFLLAAAAFLPRGAARVEAIALAREGGMNPDQPSDAPAADAIARKRRI